MFEFIQDEELRTKVQETYDNSVKEIGDKHTLTMDEAVSGLKSKNAELLDEKKQVQTKLKEFEDFDMDSAKEAMDFLQNNKDAQMIKDGKVDELIDKKTSQMRSDHEAALGEVTGQLNESNKKAGLYESLYKGKMVDDSLREAAINAKVRPEAVADILLHGRNIFNLADDNSVEARDSEGKLRKTVDDKVLTTTNWIESLKKTSPHYWPDSEGAGARGGGKGGRDDLDAAIIAASEKGDQSEYRRLLQKKKSGK